MSAVLSDAEVQQALQKLPGWKKNGNAIERNFQFANFVQAMDFVNQIAEAAEAVNHHPDIHISYNKVTMVTGLARLRRGHATRYPHGRKNQRTGASRSVHLEKATRITGGLDLRPSFRPATAYCPSSVRGSNDSAMRFKAAWMRSSSLCALSFHSSQRSGASSKSSNMARKLLLSALAQQERPNTAESQHCKWHIPSAHRPLLARPCRGYN